MSDQPVLPPLPVHPIAGVANPNRVTASVAGLRVDAITAYIAG